MAYNQTLAATGGKQPYSWTLVSGSSLPAGLTLSTGGVISGTPTSLRADDFYRSGDGLKQPRADR